MTRKWIGRAVNLTVSMLIGMGATQAAGPVGVQWNKVCSVAGNRELSITTQNGETIQGYCTRINVNEIAVTTEDKRVVNIARSALAHIRVRRANTKGHQLASLGRGMGAGLKTGLQWLLTPAAPAAIVLLPGTLAWGAVAAPFCLIGDLSNKVGGSEEINVL
jgi:hypothetical protein